MSEKQEADEGNVNVALSLSNYYIPSHYDLGLTVGHLKPNFNGELTVTLVKNTNFNGPKPDEFIFKLHADKLVVVKATVDDSKVDISYDRTNHTVTFRSQTTPLSDNCRLKLSYVGRINAIKTYKDATQGLFQTNYLDNISGRSDNYILATHFQPHGAKLVFPVVDELNIKVPIKLTITTLNKFKVMSNAKLISQTPISMSDQATFEFESTPPIASSVFGFCIGAFEYIEEMVGKIPARIYTTIGDSKSTYYGLQLVKTFLPILQDLFQVDYPLDKIDFVTLPFLNDGAMENWGMVTIISGQLLVPASSSFAARYQLQQLIAHELVHQWIGNLVSFDDWNNLWLNEAFATWLGNYVIKVSNINANEANYNYEEENLTNIEKFLKRDCFYGPDGEDQIPSISQYMNTVDTKQSATTSTIFDTNAYEKGIVLLQMVFKIFDYESKDSNKLFSGFTKIIETYKFSSIKSFDLWNILNEYTTIELLSFVHSWLRYPGYPLVTVESNDTNDKISITQHRYLFNLSVEQLKLEDQPYHVPLFVKIIDKLGNIKVLNIMLNDRSMELDIPLDQLLIINSEKSGYYRVKYDSSDIIDEIAKNITTNKLSSNDIIGTLNDLGEFLSTINSSSQDLISMFKIFNALAAESTTINFDVLKLALTYVEKINDILLHFSEYDQFEAWLQEFVLKLYEKLGKWDEMLNLTKETSSNRDSEFIVRNSILQLGLQQNKFQKLGKTMFKNFTTSGVSKKFTPKQLVSSMFNLTIYNCSSREYKNILEFVKNSDTSLLKNSDISNSELQTIAVTSLGFINSDNDELVTKTLNFIMTNIDSKLIELGLIGFQYKTKQLDKIRLFNWYKLHYDRWTLKSLRKGSDWSKQLGITMKNITTIVLGDIMNHDTKLIEMKHKFIDERLHTLPAHGLQELIEELQLANEEKERVGSFYCELIQTLNRT
jgi:aminopeptidase N